MSIIPQEHASGYCDGEDCHHWSNDLTPLGEKDFCPRCFRELIADIRVTEIREVNTSESVWEQ
jgi:hypothetical protein